MFNKVSNGIMPSGAMFQKDFKKGLQETSLEVGSHMAGNKFMVLGGLKLLYIFIGIYVAHQFQMLTRALILLRNM